jgi:hypothetical protein
MVAEAAERRDWTVRVLARLAELDMGRPELALATGLSQSRIGEIARRAERDRRKSTDLV